MDIDVDLPGRMPEAVEATAYFVVCEALTNVARHSGATRASVTGRYADGRGAAEIGADGRGGAAAVCVPAEETRRRVLAFLQS